MPPFTFVVRLDSRRLLTAQGHYRDSQVALKESWVRSIPITYLGTR
jgi:hypothetical protein